MYRLRSSILRRFVAVLALAGLLLPLTPAVAARGTTTERLTEALGHREAVELALSASHNAANPTQVFLDVYFETTGQDADEVLARLDGHALWLIAEPLAPVAVLVAAGTPSTSTSGPASGAQIWTPAGTVVSRTLLLDLIPETPAALSEDAPRALQPRGP